MNKQITEQQWTDLDTAYFNMAGSVLEFCKIVTSQTFDKSQSAIAERYKVSPATVSKWVAIGKSDRFRNAKKLPASVETLYQITRLEPDEHKGFRVTPNTTRKDVMARRAEVPTDPEKERIKANARRKESVFYALEVSGVDTVREWLNEWEQAHTAKAA